MMLKNELIAKIKDYFDLNIYETKVWLSLLQKGLASAGEIASMSGVPRSRTYDVLESLEKKGFALVKLGKPVKYFGVKPKVILEKLKNNVRSNAEERIKSLSELPNMDEFKELEELYVIGVNPVRREDLSASIKGRTIISNHLRELIDGATEEVIFCLSAEELEAKERIFYDIFSDLKKRGVSVKVALSGNLGVINHLKNYFKRDISTINVKSNFYVFDRKEILFYLSSESTKDDQAIWINSEFFCKGFVGLFDIATKK